MNGITDLLPDIKLRLNIDYPGYEETYCFGYECALAEMAESENPYDKNKKAHEYWLEGWWAGYLGEEPLFKPEDWADEKSEPVSTAANECVYHPATSLMFKVFNIASVITATVVIGYQIIELVA